MSLNNDPLEYEFGFGFGENKNDLNINKNHDITYNKDPYLLDMFFKKNTDSKISELLQDFENKKITFPKFISLMYDIFSNKSNIINKNILFEKSKLHNRFSYCDLIVKKLLLTSTSKEFIIHYENDILKKLNYILFDHIYNTNKDIDALLSNLKNLVKTSYEDVVTNSPYININSIYSNSSLELILGYLVMFNFNIELKNCHNITFLKSIIFEMCDYSISYIYNLDKYIKKQLSYFTILSDELPVYSKYYLTLINNDSKLRTLKKIIYKWFSIIGLNIEPKVNDLDSWRIYYNYQYIMIFMNNKLRNIESNNINPSDNEFLTKRDQFSNNLLNQLKLLPLEFSNKSYSISESFINCICEFKNIQVKSLDFNKLEYLFIESSLIIFKDTNNSIEVNSEIITKINNFLHDNYNILLNKNLIQNNDLWKQKYHDICIKIFDTLISSSKEIIEFLNIENIDKTLVSYKKYNTYAISIEFTSNIIKEIPRIIEIYYKLGFADNLLSNVFMIIIQFYNDSIIKNYFKNIKYNLEYGDTIINDRKEKKIIEIYKQSSISLSKIFQYVYHEYIKSNRKSSKLTSIIEIMINNNLIYKELNLETYYNIDLNSMLKYNLISLFDKKIKELEKLNNIDDEFLDPITFEIIKTPVILPDTNQFVDKTVIEQILINNPINPFTGLSLTIEQLEKYNKFDHVIEKINIFMDRLNKAKQINCD